MTPHDHRLPDILRPTELNDFGDLFSAPIIRPTKIAVALVGLAAIFLITQAIARQFDQPAQSVKIVSSASMS